MNRGMYAALLMLVGTVFTSAQGPAPPKGLDTAAIDRAVGRAGQPMAGDVYRVAFPRSDMDVSVGSVKLRTGLALGGWAAFKANGSAAVAHGDLVLADDEVNPVISVLQQHQFEITALHNHLLNTSKPVWYLHFWGQGAAPELAAAVRDAIGRTKAPAPAAAAPTSAEADFPVDAVQQAIGLRGTVTNGVLALSQPRPEQIQMMGVVLPPSMGMATAINVQSAGGGRIAATGDFVMVADEVNKVARALRQHDINITALHNHMLHGTPELYFMHFWAEGEPSQVGAGLKEALAQLAK